ncbi:MAG TPA: hypothetical protein VJR91_15295 [Burkholderia sp.]|nr:hypothetical protein [Burkholderia sp.]
MPTPLCNPSRPDAAAGDRHENHEPVEPAHQPERREARQECERSFPGAYFSFRHAVKSDIANDVQTWKIQHICGSKTVREITQNRQRDFNRAR